MRLALCLALAMLAGCSDAQGPATEDDELDRICDTDGDGFEDPVCGGDDCDDNDGDSHPGAELLCDGADNDCDGGTDTLVNDDGGSCQDGASPGDEGGIEDCSACMD